MMKVLAFFGELSLSEHWESTKPRLGLPDGGVVKAYRQTRTNRHLESRSSVSALPNKVILCLDMDFLRVYNMEEACASLPDAKGWGVQAQKLSCFKLTYFELSF